MRCHGQFSCGPWPQYYFRAIIQALDSDDEENIGLLSYRKELLPKIKRKEKLGMNDGSLVLPEQRTNK